MLTEQDIQEVPSAVESVISTVRFPGLRKDDRRELAHEALIGAMTSPKRPENLRGTLFIATVNRFMTRQRRAMSRLRLLDLLSIEKPIESVDPLQAAIRAEEVEQVAQSLARLSERDRHVIESLDGDANYNTMKQRRSRAKQKLLLELLKTRCAS